jgi:predicted MFS family arabinose efflux permease
MDRQLPRLLLPLLAAIQFTHIMDFMVLMPLGPQLMRDLHMGAGGFSALVAAYSIAAGVIGLAGAPFIDRFDRRTLVLTIYGGFLLSTLFCGLAQNQTMLMIGRVLAGGFGGISGSLCLTVVSDVVPPERRAAGIGIVMTAFALAAAIGVPIGLELAQAWSWRCPFLVVATVAMVAWVTAYNILPSLRGHLAQPGDRRKAFAEVLNDPNAWRAMAFMASMVIGHFTIIPLLSTHLVFDMHYPEPLLWAVYFVGGLLSVVTAPKVGKLADRFGRQRVFAVMVVLASLVVLAICNAGPLPLWEVLALSGAFFIFASGRFVPGQAIITLAVPATRRGAFLSLSSCVRDLMSGIASSFGGWMVTTKPTGELVNYTWLGWIAVAGGAISIWFAHRVRANEMVTDFTQKATALPAEDIPMEAGEIS